MYMYTVVCKMSPRVILSTGIDLNECANSASNSCSSNATCTNTPGGFYCTCNQGYTGNGEICTGRSKISLAISYDYLSCNFHQKLMSVPVLLLTTVTLMLYVSTLLGASLVHVTKDTLEMD